MKSVLGFTAVLLCYIALGIGLSCTHPAPKVARQRSKAKTAAKKQETAQHVPPMLIQQFGACKAHQ